MKIHWKKVKYFISLHWMKILLTIVVSALLIGLTILMVSGMHAWNNSGRFMKQQALAMMPLNMFFYLVIGIVQGCVFVFLYSQVLFKRNFGGSSQKKKAIKGEDVKITWNDVIGMDEAKQEASEVVKLITERATLQQFKGSILKGLLLIGPSGCGKTYLAKAIATESRLPFISMSGSEFVEMFVGVGAGRIRTLFKQARQLAKLEGGCIIFIDEIDAVGARRAPELSGSGGHQERNQTLNQLLVEMDGLRDKEENIVIIGATNMPEKFLDEALLRPGRFDRKIYVDFPSLEDRERIFSYYVQKTKCASDIKTDKLARLSVGSTPADIANIIKEASLIAKRNNKTELDMSSIDAARERIKLGIKRRIKLSPQEKLRAAFHEAGHVIVTYLLVPTKDVFKATIIPRGAFGGITWVTEKKELFLRDKQSLLDEIKIDLGGYNAEKIKFGSTSTGVSGDFSTATKIIHDMVWRLGMGKSGLIGSFDTKESNRMLSASVAETLNKDENTLWEECLADVEDLMRKNWDIVEKLSSELVAKDELDFDNIDAIFKQFGKHRTTETEPEKTT